MRYHLDFAESVWSYLQNMPASRLGRIKVWDFIHSSIAQVSDAVRNDPVNRLPGSSRFTMQFIFLDGGRLRTADFVIDDSGAAFGVLKLVYVDLH